MSKETKKTSKESFKEYKKRWYKENKERIAKETKKRYLENREYKLKYAKDYVTKNKESVNAYKRQYRIDNKDSIAQWRKDNKEVNRGKRLNKSFGITLDQYYEMYNNQFGLCKICGKPEESKGSSGAIKMLAVDHCHKNGVVRGLLCQKCNVALGSFNDDIEILQSAIDYLKYYER